MISTYSHLGSSLSCTHKRHGESRIRSEIVKQCLSNNGLKEQLTGVMSTSMTPSSVLLSVTASPRAYEEIQRGKGQNPVVLAKRRYTHRLDDLAHDAHCPACVLS